MQITEGATYAPARTEEPPGTTRTRSATEQYRTGKNRVHATWHGSDHVPQAALCHDCTARMKIDAAQSSAAQLSSSRRQRIHATPPPAAPPWKLIQLPWRFSVTSTGYRAA